MLRFRLRLLEGLRRFAGVKGFVAGSYWLRHCTKLKLEGDLTKDAGPEVATSPVNFDLATRRLRPQALVEEKRSEKKKEPESELI